MHREPGHPALAANRIVRATRDQYGQVARYATERVVRPDTEQAAEQVDPQTTGIRPTAQRIRNIGVDFLFVSRQPVQFRPRGLEALVEISESQLVEQRAGSSLADA
jgi:hypothetical protein